MPKCTICFQAIRCFVFLLLRSGKYQWKDSKKPKQILQDWCTLNNKPPPSYGVDSLLVDNKTYSTEDIKGTIYWSQISH